MGVALPKNAARARLDAATYSQMASGLTGAGPIERQAEEIEANTRIMRAMGEQRRVSSRMTRTAAGSGDTFSAIPRFYDPIEYWDLSGLPWNMADEGHRHKLHKWLRLYYSTHYLVPILIDIFTRFPLVGMDLECKDPKLKDFYEDLFLNQLDYPEFMVGLGREFWTVGEAFPLGSFDEDLGIWEREELINPEDVVIENYPLLGSKQLKIVPPEYLKKLAQTKSPAREYKQLEMNFPELIPYLRKGEHIPISSVLLKQVANKTTDWDDHGTPILLRGLRTLIHEEKLLASQDAIAERLYSPMILAKLGIMDLGDGQGPWVPSPEELEGFRDDMDVALSSDFRLLVHHFGIEVQNVFGREQMPRLDEDFDRIERRIMQIFGVNPSLLSAGSSATPYASSALQAEFLNQILRTYQGYLIKHYKERAAVVAEAQGHYDYEKRGQTRVPIMEEVVEYDEDGTKRIVEKHKLLIPELQFRTLDLRDEATERQFLQTLRAMGVPVPDDKLMVGVHFDFDDMIGEYNEELVHKTIAQQDAKMKTYKALHASNLPIPPDLKAEVESVLQTELGPQGSMLPPGQPGGPPGGGPGGPGGPGGGPGGGPPGGPGGGNAGEKMVMPQEPGGGMGPTGIGGGVPGGGPPAAAPGPGGMPGGVGNGQAPPASFERRPGMPSMSSTKDKSDKSGKESREEKETVDNEEKTPHTIRDVEKRDTDTVEKLPRAKKAKKYTLIDDEE
jgi:hypothetical protein